MDTSAAPSTSSTCTSETASDTLKVGLQSLAAGKRHLLTKDVQTALISLAEACKLLDEVRGTFSQESGEAHYYYGRALLEQSRIEIGLFEGGPVGGVVGPEDYEEDVEDEEEEDEEDGEEAPQLVGEESGAPEAENGAPMEVVEEAHAENGAAAAANGKKEENGAAEAENDENAAPKSPAPSNTSSDSGPATLELAWEVLEVAKLAFSRQLEIITTQEEMNQVKKRLADVHLVLGEVATESEQYGQAIQDFEIAIGLLESMDGGGEKREVAQCLFQMGLALVYAKRFVDGIAAFKRSKSLIETRIDELPKDSEERGELAGLIPELDEKIADTEETERDEQAQKAGLLPVVEEEEAPVAAAPVTAAPAASANGNAAAEKPANDISHLIRRKPTPAPAPEAAATEEPQAKRKFEEDEMDGVPIIAQPPEKKQCTE